MSRVAFPGEEAVEGDGWITVTPDLDHLPSGWEAVDWCAGGRGKLMTTPERDRHHRRERADFGQEDLVSRSAQLLALRSIGLVLVEEAFKDVVLVKQRQTQPDGDDLGDCRLSSARQSGHHDQCSIVAHAETVEPNGLLGALPRPLLSSTQRPGLRRFQLTRCESTKSEGLR
jgi:hypothetical protein